MASRAARHSKNAQFSVELCKALANVYGKHENRDYTQLKKTKSFMVKMSFFHIKECIFRRRVITKVFTPKIILVCIILYLCQEEHYVWAKTNNYGTFVHVNFIAVYRVHQFIFVVDYKGKQLI